jgi:broad specificity phosphatase PhoE
MSGLPLSPVARVRAFGGIEESRQSRSAISAKSTAKSDSQINAYRTNVRDVDTLLTQRGQEQALMAGKWLCAHFAFDVPFSSPYTRAIETMRAVLNPFSIRSPIAFEERLREIEFGILDRLTWDSVKARYPDEDARRKRG